MKKYPLVFLISFIPRFVGLLYWFRSIEPEQSLYWNFSDALIRYKVLGLGRRPETFMEPLYPLFLAAARVIASDHLFIVLLFQISAASLGAVFLYRLSLELSKKETVAGTAAIFYSFYPYLVYQSVVLSEVPLLMTLLIFSSYYYSKAGEVSLGYSCKAGIGFGLTLLTRMAAMPVWLLGCLLLFFRRQYRRAMIVFFVTALLIFPLGVRNYHLQHTVFPTRTGVNLFLGNCIYANQFIPRYNLDSLNIHWFEQVKLERPDLSEPYSKDFDAYFARKAVRFMKEHPWLTLRQKVLNILYLFFPRIVPFHPFDASMKVTYGTDGRIEIENAPHRSLSAELLYAIPYSFLLITALVGIYLRRKDLAKDWVLGIVTLGFVLVYSVFRPATRCRLPMDFVLMFYSAVAVVHGFHAGYAHFSLFGDKRAKDSGTV